MGGDWLKAKWGDIAVLDYGKSLRGYSETSGKARVYGTNGPIGWNEEALWDAPGLVVGRKGAYRGVHFSTDPYWVIDTAYSLRPKQDLNLRWAYYQLKHLDVNSIDDGSPIPSTTRDAFYVQDVVVPPRDEQDRIANLLGSLDDRIELNRRMAETLEAMARALFKSWFIDFDPVHAKVQGHRTGLSNDLDNLFPDSFGEDGMPSNWYRKALWPTLVRSIGRGISPSYAEEGILILNQKCIRAGRIDLTKARHHDPMLKNLSEGRLLASGDVVINSTGVGTLGRVAQVRQTPELLSADSHVTIVKPNEDEISATLFGLALLDLEPLIETLGRGSTGQTELSRDAVGELKVVVAARPVRQAFDKIVIPIRDRADQALGEAQTLGKLRDSLLPKLISGELRITEAENQIAAA